MDKLGIFCGVIAIPNLMMMFFPPVGWQIAHAIVGIGCACCFAHAFINRKTLP